jgi:hypothetical protein
MPALTTRQAARQRVRQIMDSALERMIPADGSKPLRGSVFADFENQAYEVGNEVLSALMEERAKLEQNAQVAEAGRCPYCTSERTYLEKETTKEEVRSPSGPVLIQRQEARCRACNGSFSPSTARLGLAQ